MRVALISREYPPFFGGGIGTYAGNIAPVLADAGCDVHVITQAYDETEPRFSQRGRLRVHRVPIVGSGTCWTASLMRFGALAAAKAMQLARSGRIDVIEAAECEGAGAAPALARASRADRNGIGRVPIVIHLHTPSEMLLSLHSLSESTLTTELSMLLASERLSLALADHVCAPSRFIATWAREHYQLPHQPTVIPYAFPMPPAVPEGPAHKRVLFVGRLEPRKGVELLACAWNDLHRSHPDWRLRLVGRDTGTGPDSTSMRGHLLSVLTEQAARTVDFIGPVEPALLGAEYAGASVCVIPSLWENFPNTCIEALAHSRPVVVSDCGGMREMFESTRAGMTFRSGDAAELKAALGAMMSMSADSRMDAGKEGRVRIARLCDPARIASLRISMYERMCGSPIASDNTQMALGCWRSLRQIMQIGTIDQMPELKPQLQQWLVREATS